MTDTEEGRSFLLDADEYTRWLDQARDTLDSAGNDLTAGDYNWSCFKAQQAAEYGVKGLLYGLGEAAFGHSVVSLLERLGAIGFDVEDELESAARQLDRHYIPTRYPNAHAEGSPFRYYERSDAESAIERAQMLLAFVQSAWAELQTASGQEEDEEA
ncbi:MAG: hypothetical protein MAG451_01680 [Anaerolineales bacterium]|nr:hypothetical protein [Anaerolineales bacterium]